MTGFYKKTAEDATESCEACNSATNYVLTCDGTPETIANITECIGPDDSGYWYYLVTSVGCVKVDSVKHCETVKDVEGTYKCASCIDGYDLVDNVCYPKCAAGYYRKLPLTTYGTCVSCSN